KRPFVQLSLEGRASNRDAVGARVRLVAGDRERWSFVNGGNGFASQSSRLIHFGLGDVDPQQLRPRSASEEGEGAPPALAVEVLWPSGARQKFSRLESGRRYHVIEGGEPRPMAFGAAREKAAP
ncbi:MAG: ASPIC/UnbV domain-containing protein, partial [Acidobacteriota bacterium]